MAPLHVFGQHDPDTLAQAADVASRAAAMALLPDGHRGYVMPIGGVAAYRNQVSVVGVGFDIACGVAALETDLTRAQLGEGPQLARLADALHDALDFGIGRKNSADDAPIDHPLFDDPRWDALPRGVNVHNLKGKARAQLGTIGSGNHFVDVCVDERDRIWIMAHFGSRGFGHTVASGFMAMGQGERWDAKVPEREVLLDLDSELGERYWALMSLAGDYAYAGREWVVRHVARLLGANETDLVHQHHNSAWREVHDVGDGPEELVVVRKGATPAAPGERGAIGGSMGDDCVIVAGVVSDDPVVQAMQAETLRSTVHGAGRVMSRTKAAGKLNYKTRQRSGGAITPDMQRAWLAERGTLLRGGGTDEAPQAYRRLPEVLAAVAPTITVERTLRPLIVVMAGDDVVDPYKD